MRFVVKAVLLSLLLVPGALASPQTADVTPVSQTKTIKPKKAPKKPKKIKAASKPKPPKAPSYAKARKPPQAPKPKKIKQAKSKPRLTPADASGLRDARPGTLKWMGLAVLERDSAAEEQNLESYARQHGREASGALARMVLGYHAYQKKHYPEAKVHFEAVLLIPNPIQDYAQYYLAMSNLAEGQRDAAIQNLEGFAAKYPGSSLRAQATLREAEALVASDRAGEAIPVLASPAAPLPQNTADLLLGEAYIREHRFAEAAPLLQRIFYLNPTSPQAGAAEKYLMEARLEMGSSYPNPTEEMLEQRAERLFAAGQCKDAESEYRAVAALASGAERDRARVRAGACQFQAGDSRGALTALRNLAVNDPESDAERIYTLAALYRHLDQAEAMEQQVELLGRAHPDSTWYERALFLAGNQYLVSQDPDRAAQYYTMIYQKFPQGELAPESHWRVAWRCYREGKLAEARALFEEHIRDYPASPQLSASIYWAGRTLEQDSPAEAALYYKKLVSTFPNFYYGLVAEERLATLKLSPAAASVASDDPPSAEAALLETIRRPVPDTAVDNTNLPPDIQNRRVRARLLESAWLIDLAIDELKSGTGQDYASNFFLGRELAHLEEARGRYNVALEYGKRLLNGYFAFDLDELPRDDWELLFPRPWWSHIQQKADALHLDPYLVAGLIRQESEFNPEARSHSNALGLMQLLPSTAQRMAKQMSGGESRYFRLASLTLPEYNVAYGTFYLRQLLNQFNGSAEQSLAAYNAGENRVVEWLRQGNYQEPAEFVESIPFTETREYVQAVLRNAALYRKLYQEQPQTAKSEVLSRTPSSSVIAATKGAGNEQ